ncbi:MAG: hypothetical protein R3E10_11130 [Gemmatimonadota bacterium]
MMTSRRRRHVPLRAELLLLTLAACGGEGPAPAIERVESAPLPVQAIATGGAAGLQDAIDTARTPVRLVLSAGDYHLEGGAVLHGDGIVLTGAGADSTVLEGGVTVRQCLGCRIEHLTVRGAPSAQEVVRVESGVVELDDVRLQAGPGTETGIAVTGGSLTADGILLDAIPTGVLVEAAGRAGVRHSIFDGGVTGVEAATGADVVVVDNLFLVSGCAIEGADTVRTLNAFLGNLISASGSGAGCPELDTLRVDDPAAVPVLLELARYPALRGSLPRP